MDASRQSQLKEVEDHAAVHQEVGEMRFVQTPQPLHNFCMFPSGASSRPCFSSGIDCFAGGAPRLARIVLGRGELSSFGATLLHGVFLLTLFARNSTQLNSLKRELEGKDEHTVQLERRCVCERERLSFPRLPDLRRPSPLTASATCVFFLLSLLAHPA
jgi:hypothetical protein